jgi:molybdate/tungstate transport system substrate-binding protein
MERKIGPAFQNYSGDKYSFLGEGHGSIQDANMIIDGQRFPDVFISVGDLPMQMLIHHNPPLAKSSKNFASDEMVLGYNSKSKFAIEFKKASQGEIPWYEALNNSDVKLLRTDPRLDPKGCYTIIVSQLAGIYYHNENIGRLLVSDNSSNSQQIRPEEILVTALDTGEADIVPLYKHEAIERNIPFIRLPDEINLGQPAFASYYKQASCSVKEDTKVYGEPIVFMATVPTTVSNYNGAASFVEFLVSSTGQRILENEGFNAVNNNTTSSNNAAKASQY